MATSRGIDALRRDALRTMRRAVVRFPRDRAIDDRRSRARDLRCALYAGARARNARDARVASDATASCNAARGARATAPMGFEIRTRV